MKTNSRYPLCFRLLLCEDSQDKVGLSVGLKGGGDDEVLAGGQTDAGAHLPEVNEGLGASARLVAQEEIFLQVDILTASVLRSAGEKNKAMNLAACSKITWRTEEEHFSK